MKKMTEYGSTPFLFWFSFLCLLHSLPVYSAKSSHRRFPSLLISPEEKISLSARQNQLYTTKYFTQVLDHFNYPKSYETFQHRYLINDTYWGGAKSNSPIFVYTGNEGNIEWFAENTGFLYETAPHFKALIIFIEHRFYGKSLPFGGKKDVAYSNATTLGYLSSTQALADYASLIIDLKKNLTATDSPVVVLGGSHGEMLAAWFRLKYPHVTIGALASSSPILNFNNITSPESFNNIITKDFMTAKGAKIFSAAVAATANGQHTKEGEEKIKLHTHSYCCLDYAQSESESCYKVIKGSWQQIKDTAKQHGGLELLQKSFKLCNVDDLQNWLESAFIYTAMTDYPTPSNFMTPVPAYPVKQMCKAIDNPATGNDTFAKLYGAVTVYYNYSGTTTCFDPDDNSDPHDLGGWDWQACTEMIMQTNGNDKESIFPPSESQYKDQVSYCKEAYGVEPRPNWITTEFGGHDIKRVLRRYGSNIIFFNGLRDPWSGGGVLSNISKRIVAIVAKEGAHHVDLRFKTNEDPEWLKDVRKQEVKIIAKWISEYYHDLADKH